MNILCKHSIVIQKYLVRRVRSVSTFASEFNKVPTQAAFSLKDFKKHRESQGLFEIHELQSHNGFSTLKKDVTRNAQRLVDEATSPSRTRKLVQVFDELSDELCRVADMADFVRIGHPDSKYRAAAEDACMSVSSIVQHFDNLLYVWFVE
ncbi:hypothetical protein EB796_019877 [Bugula neritina]|uniref:Uncharacterized protein n=1 Tax=Bugula neritina TaxID=10212 RepID=A0A7J7J6N8_BUGNE|nr:hypothetical protein EB796_019877 [Bugula neritina]